MHTFYDLFLREKIHAVSFICKIEVMFMALSMNHYVKMNIGTYYHDLEESECSPNALVAD